MKLENISLEDPPTVRLAFDEGKKRKRKKRKRKADNLCSPLIAGRVNNRLLYHPP